MMEHHAPGQVDREKCARNAARLDWGRRAGITLVGLLLLSVPLLPAALGAAAQTPVVSDAAMATAGTETVAVYFLRTTEAGDKRVATAHRTVVASSPEDLLAHAVAALLAGPTAEEANAGLSTSIPDGTEIRVIAPDNSGTATLEVPADLVADGTGAALPEALAQIVFTLTQAPSVENVRLLVDGDPASVATPIAGAGELLDRSAFERQTPQIFVESVAVGDVVSSPVRVSGTANTFEGGFFLKIVQVTDDPNDEDLTLVEMPVQATSGSGTRGTFDESVEFTIDASGPGKLVVYQQAASGEGQFYDVTEIPLILAE